MKTPLKIILIFLSVLTTFTARSQVVVQINAGSRALWGTNQNLYIDQAGHCRYYLNEVRGAIKDSAVCSIPVLQLDTLLYMARQNGFLTSKAGMKEGWPMEPASLFL